MAKDGHVNTVRLHAMPHPAFYLDLADEMGLVVVAESGLWGSNCNFNYDSPEFWQRAAVHNERMVLRDRNHPSIVGWSVMNEWRLRAESTRNQILARSENEARPSGAALVEFTDGPTRWLVASLPASAPTPQHRELFRTLFRQLGVQLAQPRPLASPILSADGTLKQALVLGPFTAASYEAACTTDFLSGSDAAQAGPGAKTGGLEWKAMNANDAGEFVLNALIADPQARHAAAYLTFSVFCPRSDDLLENPRGAKLDVTAASDDGIKVWLNSKVVLDAPDPRPISNPPFELPRLSLRRGWNQFVIRVANTHGDWKLRVRLQCSDPALAPLLQTALARE